jgi:hypothetical protein
MSYARGSAYSPMSNLLNDHDTCYEDFELWFITFKVKMGSKGLGTMIILKIWFRNVFF